MEGGIGAVKAEARLMGLVERERAGLGLVNAVVPLNVFFFFFFFSFFFSPDFSYFNFELKKIKNTCKTASF